MSKTLRYTFLVHMIVSAVLGVLLLVIPGTFLARVGWQAMLQSLDWENTDPFASRVLGAALLALAWSSFRGWRASERAQVSVLVEVEALFCVLGCAGLLRHLIPRVIDPGWWPAPGWTAVGILAAFAVAWIVGLFSRA